MWATESFFYNSGRQLVLEEMQGGNRNLQQALHNLLEHEQWPWNLHIRVGQRLQKPLEAV
jgi:hypothetical protein